MQTKLTEMLEVEHPIIQGSMHFVGFAPLASAVMRPLRNTERALAIASVERILASWRRRLK